MERDHEEASTVLPAAPTRIRRYSGHPRRSHSPKLVERLSEKSLGDHWSAGFGSATLQKEVLRAPFEQFVRSSARGVRDFSDSLRRGVLGR